MKNSNLTEKTFIALLSVIFIVGCLIWIRPTQSELEKRSLAKFPEVKGEAVLDGSFFKDVSTWYADTFPFREKLIAGGAKIKQLYGLKGEAIYGDTVAEVEEVPEVDETVEAAPVISEEEVKELTDGAGTIGDAPEFIGSVYVAGGRAFEVFYFAQENMDTYASCLNTIRQSLPADVRVFDIAVPNSLGVYMDESKLDSMKASNQGDAIEYLYARLDEGIEDVDIYDLLRSHNDEYLYFRTDHHWTQRGAYYAYRAFCEKKGIEPHELSEYESVSYDDFLGSFYASTDQSQVLLDNIDSVEGFIPLSTNEETIQEKDGSTFSWNVIYDVNTYPQNLKYSAFIGGDYPLITIKNPNINDGSSCLLIKESFGNAFAPFLVDHYDTVYIVDYRYSSGNLKSFVEENQINDVIFMNNMTAITKTRAALILSKFTN